jgi:hypothetical protein
VAVDRVTFEAMHLPNSHASAPSFRSTGDFLRSHGFELVFGGFKAPLSTWHHVKASSAS